MYIENIKEDNLIIQFYFYNKFPLKFFIFRFTIFLNFFIVFINLNLILLLIFILFFILILYFYYHQFFRYFQRINNAINYNISRKFIIGLCCHKETLALKIKTVVPNCLLFLLPSCGR